VRRQNLELVERLVEAWDFSVYTGALAPLAGGHGAGGSHFFRP
jgi:hypothetical protein